jgi:hypothetical protein
MADIGIGFRRATDNNKKKQTVSSYVLAIAAAVNQSDDRGRFWTDSSVGKITKEEESIDKRFLH